MTDDYYALQALIIQDLLYKTEPARRYNDSIEKIIYGTLKVFVLRISFLQNPKTNKNIISKSRWEKS